MLLPYYWFYCYLLTASWLQLKRMFKKDSVKKTEHLEVQGMDRPLTDHPLVGGLELIHTLFCSLIFQLQRVVLFQIKACLVQR